MPAPRVQTRPWIFAAMAAALATACSTTPVSPPASPEPLTFVVVRHAEKATDDPENPALSPAGQARAQALAAQLADAPLRAAYATEYRRTQQTAQPTADAHRVPVSPYYAKGPAAESAARWRQQHAGGTVLIVGHSNTVPDLVAALCQCATTPMDDREYDRLSIIRIDAAGRATLEVASYGAPGR